MRMANRIASILIIIFALIIIYQSLQFDYMVEGTPGPGFLPFWLGVFIALTALIPLIKTFTGFASKLANPFKTGEFNDFFIVLGSATVAAIITPITGLLVALGLMIGTIARLMGNKNWKTVIGVAVVTPILLYTIFVFVLAVPVPKGIFGF